MATMCRRRERIMVATMSIPIVLADPHPAARAALAALLADDHRLAAVATADPQSASWALARRRAPVPVVARR
jgi:DNA-binding NarL/FixJ family response regulator